MSPLIGNRYEETTDMNPFQVIRNWISPSRVATAIGVLGAIAAFIAALQTNFAPGSPWAESLGKALVAVAAVYKALTTIEKFLDGSQNWDSLMQAGVPKAPGVTVVNQHDAVPSSLADLGPHPDNDQSPEYIGHEITPEDVKARFGTVDPLSAGANQGEAMRGFGGPSTEPPLLADEKDMIVGAPADPAMPLTENED